MSGYILVLALAALPAGGNFAGGVLAEVFRVSERALSLALHLAAGIVLAVVGLELMPEALQATEPWVPLLAFVGGGAAFIGLDRAIGHIQARIGRGGEKEGSALAIFSGVSLDLFSDGVMIGTGTVLNPALGVLLALGQVPADVPEGFAAVATLRNAGIKRKEWITLAAGFASDDVGRQSREPQRQHVKGRVRVRASPTTSNRASDAPCGPRSCLVARTAHRSPPPLGPQRCVTAPLAASRRRSTLAPLSSLLRRQLRGRR